MTIVASWKGFYPAEKRPLLCHSLVTLLQQISRALMKAFTEHNKFGNLPYSFRANTWVAPLVVADNPSVFLPLPVEDENWEGNGGGSGRDVFKAIVAIKNIIEINQNALNGLSASILQEEKVGDLIIKVIRDVSDANVKLDCKNEGSQVLGMPQEELVRRNLLKGITADESATVHDTYTLGVVVVRHCGYTTVVKVSVEVN
ncbi:hypothetical protein J1N35_024501 [Gossypium stocksii]|uniref:Uncharacterized protein n=1 Tax=Gossypium stocksii TaxID=47602 RepID=A0A9D3V5S8_9ROSI|nr:hypothetical protein J1N35_024501 [Gossypium stocksii]